MVKKYICEACEKSMTKEEWDSLGFYGENGEKLCDICYSEDMSDGSTILFLKDGEKEDYCKGSYTIQGEYDDSQRSEVYDYIRSIKWITSGGYRGYYEGKAPKGWVMVKNSWFSGFDGHNMDQEMTRLEEKLKNEEYPNIDVMIGFLRTSNVFSTGFELLIRNGEEEAFKEWLSS